MTKQNRLAVIATEPSSGQKTSRRPADRKEAAQAKFERLWLRNPEQFNPERNGFEKERSERTLSLISSLSSTGQKVADLGCGYGFFSTYLAKKGDKVDAVDVAIQPLKRLEQTKLANIEVFQEYVPLTKLLDDHYDLVLALDLIAYLHPLEHRLFFSEVARIVKTTGQVICSTPLDFHTENPLETFAELAETEFMIDQWIISYHRLGMSIHRFFSAPSTYIKGRKDSEYRHYELEKRKPLSRAWFRMQTSAFGFFWPLIHVFTAPLAHFTGQNQGFIRFTESICKALWADNGISHAIFLGKRRPMVFPNIEPPKEVKGKKQVWE